jgi:hypothetical protein
MLLLLSGLLALAVALASTPAGQEWLDGSEGRWNDFVYWFQGLFA